MGVGPMTRGSALAARGATSAAEVRQSARARVERCAVVMVGGFRAGGTRETVEATRGAEYRWPTVSLKHMCRALLLMRVPKFGVYGVGYWGLGGGGEGTHR
jgi:hypothetical protein